ncbi:MAG: TerC family protein [Syntrophales bacterium]|nr:TerC family protein [Syntrophales bacterium]
MHFDWATVFHVEYTWTFGLALLNIMFINLILSGDNAVLIAMAVRNLPVNQRRTGIIFGTGAAVVLRIILTYFVALLLEVSFIKLIGGLLILWIAVKLLVEGDENEGLEKVPTTMWQAVKIILIADLTMSLDNVLAVAGAAGGNLFLLIFGLLMSIPIVIFTSEILSRMMDKYPIIIIIGGAILGRVGGEMIVNDHIIEQWLHPSKTMDYTVQVLCTIGVVVVAKLWMKWKVKKALSEGACE